MKKQLISALSTILLTCVLYDIRNKAMYGLILMLIFLVYALIANKEKQRIQYSWPILPVLAYIIVRGSHWFEYINFGRIWMVVLIYAAWMVIGYFIGFFASKWKAIQKNHTLSLLSMIAIILMLLSSLIAKWGDSYFFGSGIVYLLIPYIAHRYVTKNKYAPLIIIAPYILLHIIVFFCEDVMVEFYPVLFIPLVSIGIYYLIRLFKKQTIPIVIGAVYILFLGYGWYAGMKSYINWLYVQQSKLTEKQVEFRFYTLEGRPVTPFDLKDKIVILDFWNSSCGVCFRSFPEYDKFYNKYRHRDDIAIYSVNLPIIGRDTEDKLSQTIDRLSTSYSFPILQADSSDYFKRFKMSGVPHLLVLDKNGEVAYNGNLEFSGKVAYNIDAIVGKLIKNTE